MSFFKRHTTNLLTLNSSKTEFLFIWLKNQLAKIHNSSLDTSHSARNLGFIFDEISLTKLLLSPKPVTITFVNFAVSGLTSIRQLPVPLLPLSSTSNLNFCRLIISHWRPHHVFKRAATIPWSVHFLPVFFAQSYILMSNIVRKPLLPPSASRINLIYRLDCFSLRKVNVKYINSP